MKRTITSSPLSFTASPTLVLHFFLHHHHDYEHTSILSNMASSDSVVSTIKTTNNLINRLKTTRYVDWAKPSCPKLSGTSAKVQHPSCTETTCAWTRVTTSCCCASLYRDEDNGKQDNRPTLCIMHHASCQQAEMHRAGACLSKRYVAAHKNYMLR